MAEAIKTPYDSAKRLIPPGNLPGWLNEYDQLRYAAYGLYEDIYWTEPQTFKLQQRGNDENPLYIPSGRIIVNTMVRYFARNFRITIDPDFGDKTTQATALLTFRDLVKRERLKSQFNTNKLYGTMRGDWFWYITGNPAKPEGKRISVRSLDPRMVFPINPKTDVDRILGYDIVEQTIEGDTTYISRTRYLKPEHEQHPQFGTVGAPISYQVDILEVENWETEPKIHRTIQPPVLMPGINNLPLYHIKNMEEPGNPFGSSEMRGLERIMAAVNQSMSDEELTLALHGLGMYKSQKGQPRDAQGNPTNWQLGPGRVVHDETFERVSGVTAVTPYLDHVKYLEDRMHRVNGASDVAQGVVDVTVAESGIALALRMGPIIDTGDQKEQTVQEVMDNMLFDLREWFSAYENLNLGDTRAISGFGSKLPTNTKEEFDRLYQMVTADPPLITMGYFRDACRELGMDIPMDVNSLAIAQEQAQFQEVADPTQARLDEELNNPPGDGEDGGINEE